MPSVDGLLRGLGDTWAWVNDNGTGLAAVAAIVTGVFAAVALRQTARDSRERTRPYVIAEYQRIPYASGTLALVVQNTGQSVATDVKVTFDDLGPEAKRTGSLVEVIARRYDRTFLAMPPGQAFANSVRTSARNAKGEDKPEDTVTATVTYKHGRKRYTETFVLDCTVYAGEVTTSSTESPEGRLKEIRDAVRSIADEVGGARDDVRSAVAAVSRGRDLP
jgi:hypothetical protein